MIKPLRSTLQHSVCPVCADDVSASATKCRRCGTEFLSGEWTPLHPQDGRKPLQPSRLVLLAIITVVLAAVATGIVGLIAAPLSTGDGGHISIWSLLVLWEFIASAGLPLFVALSLLGLLALGWYAKQQSKLAPEGTGAK